MDSFLDVIWFVISSFVFIACLVVFLRIPSTSSAVTNSPPADHRRLFTPVRGNGRPDR